MTRTDDAVLRRQTWGMTQRGLDRVVLVASLCLASACGELRTQRPAEPSTPTYVDDIQPLLRSKCVSCHGENPDGEYDLRSWIGVLGPGSDKNVRNAIPGEAQSLLLVRVGAKADADHKGLLDADALRKLGDWVVAGRMLYSRNAYHPPGWLHPEDRTSQDFHGGFLRSKSWDTAECRGCHGADLKGGLSGKSCFACHEGPEGCSTCHGVGESDGPPPDLSWSLDPKQRGVGAHLVHASTKVFAPIDCEACHKTPSKVDDVGHLHDDADRKQTDFRAEVTMDERSSVHGVGASYDSERGTCQTYCHGASLPEPAKAPMWTSTETSSKSCTASCHAVPAAFGGPDCSSCHPRVVEPCKPGAEGCLETAGGQGVRFFELKTHGDGMLEIGKAGAEGTCWSCHGTEASQGAPGPDLSGKTDISTLAVGLHAAHLGNPSASAPSAGVLVCEHCHEVPNNDKDKGHFDDDLPAEITFSDFAKGKLQGEDLKPTWDRETATCKNVFCHDLGGATVKSWRWTKKVDGGLTCSSCHGDPPLENRSGAPHPSSTQCDACHETAYVDGKLDATKHLNGKVDL